MTIWLDKAAMFIAIHTVDDREAVGSNRVTI
jgi:hypothetical protein